MTLQLLDEVDEGALAETYILRLNVNSLPDGPRHGDATVYGSPRVTYSVYLTLNAPSVSYNLNQCLAQEQLTATSYYSQLHGDPIFFLEPPS